MRWHLAPSKPVTDKDKILCLVEIKEEFVDSSFYQLMYWHNRNNGYFSAYEDPKGINGLKEDFIIRWVYIEDDDCLTDEMMALTAIQDAVNHVQSLYNILLTDGICCGKEYRDLVGLDELQTIKEKLTKRILYLDNQIKI